jgi:hypothetical protein
MWIDKLFAGGVVKPKRGRDVRRFCCQLFVFHRICLDVVEFWEGAFGDAYVLFFLISGSLANGCD